MVYDIDAARTTLRLTFPNAGDRSVGDDTLDLALLNGLRRLSNDKPRVVDALLSAPIPPSVTLSFPKWVDEFSHITAIRTAPQTGVTYEPEALDPRRYRVLGSNLYIDVTGLRAVDLIVEYTTLWEVQGLGGATTTTLSPTLETAHIWAACANLALILAAKMVGTTDRQVAADFINFRTRSQEYREMAKAFEANYRCELGLEGKGPAPVIATLPYVSSNSADYTYHTHRSSWSWR